MNRVYKNGFEVPISVIMPVYNAEPYLADAMESVLHQSFREFEFLIIDDGSCDASRDVIESYARRDKRIIWSSRANRGLPATLNELIERAHGKYLARMDADDISDPERFVKQFDYMERHPEVSVLGTSIRMMETGKCWVSPYCLSDDVQGIRLMFRNAVVPHPTAFLRAGFFKEKGLHYNEANVAAEDYELWSEVVCNGGVITTLEEPLLQYRTHEGQMTDVHAPEKAIWDSRIKKKMILRFGEFEEREIEELVHLFDLSQPIDADILYQAMQNLLYGNVEREIYNEGLLKKELAFQWLWAAYARRKGRGDMELYRAEYIKKMISPEICGYILRNVLMIILQKGKSARNGLGR